MILRAFPLYAATVVLAPAGPAAAQDQRTISAHNMQLAVEICLRNYRTETTLPQAFGAAGFSVSPGPDAGYASFAADGVTGAFSTSQAQGFCSVQSTLVDLATANGVADTSGVEEGRDLLRRIAAMLTALSKVAAHDS